jgi:16S rRNA C967 or C1407 C5-methylase (RsmB/RsmF family)/NOL1/NOP2/fmu family ribosome biogenesis protein
LPHLPTTLIARFRETFDKDADAFLASFDLQEKTSIRLNAGKLTACPYPATSIPWDPNGYFLNNRPAFIFDPLWHAGAYYVQDSSSMFVGYLLTQAGLDKNPATVLDACAAPGGKSTQLLSCLHPDSLLVANEVIPKRNKILTENIIRWGKANAMVTQADPHEIGKLGHFFDLIIADAPCSGEGMMRRDPKVATEWSEKIVDTCASRQTHILKDLIPALKPGGYLLYSTCTYEAAENEEQVKYLLNNGFLPVKTGNIPSAAFAEVTTLEIKSNTISATAYRFDLHKASGSGFFCCLLKKSENYSATPTTASSFRKSPFLIRNKSVHIQDWLGAPEQYVEALIGDWVLALPALHAGSVSEISGLLRTTYAGVQAGQLKTGHFTPAHPLSLTRLVRPDIVRMEVSRADAIAYLRKDTLTFATNPAIGWLLLTYQGLGIGWAKSIPGGRINNYLPANWRIVKQIS